MLTNLEIFGLSHIHWRHDIVWKSVGWQMYYKTAENLTEASRRRGVEASIH